ncbi:MAG: hypothetical protein GWM98_16525 [Nitrospinaceae bacterium]|nr:hypothetical protein [Nitrospinaceae bacterium]NIR55795.1 hypothetical protein [Nitrospinaceae bacterium]NIS88152.1 hypothetical protein [Nitrospinaceae bacterium]NIT83077.1 hypothetical protein [Nitrospinaceae bacterium]NIU45287.1 hypothetical protein [Nitrospinaceae bacterium]
MQENKTDSETKVKILLDEANLAFCETTERKDTPGDRRLDGSAWDQGKMEGEYDEEDFRTILELQMKSAQICDDHPELEQKTADMFQSVTGENAEEVLKEFLADPQMKELARISVLVFLLRFPNVQSFVNKGHPLVLATDEYMLENADAQNWKDYRNIAEEFGWM